MPNAIGTYTAILQCVNVNNARTLMLITVPAPYIVEVVEAHVTVPDTTDRQLECLIKKATTTSTAVGSSANIIGHAVSQSDPCTVIANCTTEPSYSGSGGFGYQALPGRSGWHFDTSIAKETTISANSTANTGLGVYLNSGIAVNTVVDVSMTYRVFG